MEKKDNKVYYGLCYVVEDKPEDSFDIKVMLVSLIPDTKGKLSRNDKVIMNEVDINGLHKSIVSTSSDHITATWLPDGEQNRISAPDVCKGDIVEVYTVNDTHEYYWKVYAHNQSLRKREKVLYWFSNKGSVGGTSKDAYFLLVDTRNKVVLLHTSDNDGEACAFDLLLDTKQGKAILKDNMEDTIMLDAPAGKLSAFIREDIHLKTKNILFDCDKFTVNAKSIDFNSIIIKFVSAKHTVETNNFGLSADNSTVTGGSISHDGVNIGKTHEHKQRAGDHFGAGGITYPPNNI